MKHLLNTFGVFALITGLVAAFLIAMILAIGTMIACTNHESTLRLSGADAGEPMCGGDAVDSAADFVRFHYEADWDDMQTLEREFGVVR